MKKGMFFVIVLCAFALVGISKAQAVYFTNTVDFEGREINGVSCMELVATPVNNNFYNPFVYQHSLSDIPSGATLQSASLSIYYSGNYETFDPELWLVLGDSNYLLGALSATCDIGEWTVQEFNLSGMLGSIMQTNPWSLRVRLCEITQAIPGLETPESVIYLDKSELSGDYTEGAAPVPEPAGMVLFGSGLLGLVGFAGRKFGSR